MFFLALVNWTDSHCHLDGFFRNGTLPKVLEKARHAGVSRFIAIGTEPDDWEINRKISQLCPKEIFYTVGIHPNHVDDHWLNDSTRLAPYFEKEPKPVAIGEIGLDYFRLPKKGPQAELGKARQKEAFGKQLELAQTLDVPVVIHCRDAFSDCLEVIDASGISWDRVVLHCFSGGPAEIRYLLKRGGRASFTGIVTFPKTESLRDAVKIQGTAKLMIETDCPYLSPVPFRGQPNEPANLRHIGAFLSQLLEIEEEELAETTSRNAESFFSLVQ